MEFQALGPLRVVDGSAAADPSPGKQLALLACLLIARGEVVSRDRLVDALWGERPPAAAANALQVHVHGLRRRVGAERIVREGPGYRLRLEPGELDVERFERLVARGRDERAGGDDVATAATLREALALWRGPAYEDVRYEPFAETEAARLEELRLAALEDRIEAELDLGGHRDLVPELEALVAEHPLRERLGHHLMLALYRGERQAEALEVFARASAAMRDELGLEPGPALRELQAAILRQDAALRPTPAAAAAAPAPGTPLVGRRGELAELATLLRGEARLVTLTGAGGIGKTRLALELARVLAGDFAGGVHFADLSPLTDPEMVPEAIGDALGLANRRGEPPRAALTAFLRSRELLLILDNFERVDDAAPLVGELLRAAPGLTVLVTSRAPLRLTGEHQHRVEPLALTEAAELFAARAGAVAPAFRRPGEDDAQVAALCRRLDCLPLAIELAAARTRDYAPGELLASGPGALGLAGQGPRDLPPRQRTLRATIGWSHELLSGGEQALFARLAVFAGGFTGPSAAAVCGAGRETLAALVGASLVRERPGPGGAPRWSMLETVREYARERLDERGEADDLGRRHAEHYAALAEAAEDEHPASRAGAAWRELEAEHANFRAALDWSRAAGAVELELRLVGALGYFWATSDHLAEARALIDTALAHGDGSPAPLRANALAGAAHVAHSLGDYERMRDAARASLELFRRLGDDRRTALALNQLGIALSDLGDIEGGLATHEENAALARRLGDGVRLAAALNNLGYCRLQRGDHEAARARLREGLAVSREIGHRTGESAMLGNLGLAALLERDPQPALGLFREALEIDRELDYAEGLIYGLVGIAAALSATEQRQEAAVLLAAADAAARATAVELEPLEQELHAETTRRLHEALGPEGFAAARADGEALSLEQAVDRALSTA